MLQRIQTIYLLLAFICMALLLVFPIFSIEIFVPELESTKLAVFGANGIESEETVAGLFPFYGVIISLALFSLMGLLFYKNRKRQLMMTRISLVLHLLVVVAIYLFYYLGKPYVVEYLSNLDAQNITVTFFMEIGFFLLIPTIPLLILAIRGIKRDENLIKSLDRLR
ncbi:DUF4293 domain-containing protein [Crocinitomix catalasitica]|uniref:DUF4293 domain-containing protein n=1 Tax=Crocinitomix catalasitica TaxID=184607 RepID=UPI000481E015|nr:DUF4293 domain-containing protein [Crocinitomix catalasitica]